MLFTKRTPALTILALTISLTTIVTAQEGQPSQTQPSQLTPEQLRLWEQLVPSPSQAETVTQTLGLRRALTQLNTTIDKAQAPESAKDSAKAKAEADKAKADAIAAMEQALTHMGNGIVVVSGWERSLILYHSLNLTTAPWRKRDIRSRYEKIRDWGSAAGGLVAAAALLANGDKSKTNTVAAGGGLIGLSQLTAALFGQKVSRAYTENMVFLDMSVRAYDDLKAHKARLTKAADENETVLKKKIDTVAASLAAADTADKKLATLPKVLEIVDQYQAAVRQLLTINDDVQELASRALLSLKVPDTADTDELRAIRADLQQVATGAKEWETKYEATVYEFFNVSASTRASLTNAQGVIKKSM